MSSALERSSGLWSAPGADDKLPFACAARTPIFGLLTHGSLVLNGTFTVNGQGKSFSKTVEL